LAHVHLFTGAPATGAASERRDRQQGRARPRRSACRAGREARSDMVAAQTPAAVETCGLCRRKIEFLERQVAEARASADAGFRREHDLRQRIEGLTHLLEKMSQRVTLPSEQRSELSSLLASAVPPQDFLEDSIGGISRSHSSSSLASDIDAVDVDVDDARSFSVPRSQVWDYPLSQGEKLMRLYQLFDNECKIAAEEVRELKGKRRHRVTRRRAAKVANSETNSAPQARDLGDIPEFADKARRLHNWLDRCSMVGPLEQGSTHGQQQTPQQLAIELDGQGYWQRSAAPFKELFDDFRSIWMVKRSDN